MSETKCVETNQVERIVMRKMNNVSIWDYTPKWWPILQETCPVAITYFNNLLESIDNYRGYIKKQNSQINELMTENHNLKVDLMYAQDDDRCRKIAFDAYVSEVLNTEESKSTEPF